MANPAISPHVGSISHVRTPGKALVYVYVCVRTSACTCSAGNLAIKASQLARSREDARGNDREPRGDAVRTSHCVTDVGPEGAR